MDELKQTTDAGLELATVAVNATDETTAVPTTPAVATDGDANDAATESCSTTMVAPMAAMNESNESTTEKWSADEPCATKAEVLERLRAIVTAGGEISREWLDRLKTSFYRLHHIEVAAEREAFVANGGDAADFKPAHDADEDTFKALMSEIKELRFAAAEALEATLKRNLERKLAIVERIKELAANADDADKGYDEVKQLQAEWKDIKQVPAQEATNLWKNYQHQVEVYYDQLRMNHELRAYDFKKNLEQKTALCEAAEKLAEENDVISAFRKLQVLHQEYREIGPVAKEQREELWKRFKDASTVVNKHHQAHFEAIKAQEADNLAQKDALTKQVEELPITGVNTYLKWDELTKQVLELQAKWKTIGFASRKANTEAYERFRAACDHFFQEKATSLKASRDRLQANLTAKMALVEEAEKLRDSKDWGATTARLVELQAQWKRIGTVPQKVSDEVWHRFNGACNAFFHAKQELNASAREEEAANLKLKTDLIEELKQVVESGAEDALQRVRDLQTKWNTIGHVPFNKKEKLFRVYREWCDKFYNERAATAGRRRLADFHKHVADMAEQGGGELARERARLQNVLEAKRQEIKTYETNLSFFRSSSKKGNSLVADAEKKVDRLKQDLVEINDKLKAVIDQIKAAAKSE